MPPQPRVRSNRGGLLVVTSSGVTRGQRILSDGRRKEVEPFWGSSPALDTKSLFQTNPTSHSRTVRLVRPQQSGIGSSCIPNGLLDGPMFLSVIGPVFPKSNRNAVLFSFASSPLSSPLGMVGFMAIASWVTGLSASRSGLPAKSYARFAFFLFFFGWP